MINYQNKRQIENVINNLANEYNCHKGLILTEDDLKCRLLHMLSNISSFTGNHLTREEDVTAPFVHAELSWYGRDNKLSIKPDITIINPRHLSIKYNIDRNLKLPSKGFSFDGKAFVFELKFIRQKSGITNSVFRREILKDWDKIQNLFVHNSDNRDNLFCYFIIFSKWDKSQSDFDAFLLENSTSMNHKIIYKSASFNE